MKPKTIAGFTTVGQLCLASFAAWALAATVLAGDILPQIAADSKMALIVRDPAGFTTRVNKLLCRIKPGTPPKSLPMLISAIGLPPNSIDENAPLAIVYPPGGMVGGAPVLIFKPQSADSWPLADPEQPVTVAKLGQTCFVRRDQWVFACESQRPVLRALRASSRRSLDKVLDSRERALLNESDTLLRLRVDAWQGEIGQAVALLRLFGNAGAIGSDDPQSQAQAAAIGWFADGVGKVAADMRVLDLGLKIDDEAVRFVHYHAFRPESSAANYLKGVKRTGGDIWRGLERRPFLVAFAWDAKAAQDSGIMQDLMSRMMKMPGICGAATQPAMTRILADCEEFYHRELASATLVELTPRGTLGIIGTKDFDDASKGVELLRRISEGGSQVMDDFAPSWASGGEFKQVRHGDLDVMEMSFSTCKSDQKHRGLIEVIYGKDAIYQIAALGKNSLAYSISTDPTTIERVARAADGKAPTLGQLPAVKTICGSLPRDPCMLAFVDVERATRFLPAFTQADESVEIGKKRIAVHSAGARKHAMQRPREQLDMPPGSGPLIGWAMTTGPDWVRGEAYMSQDDIVKSVPLLKRMSQAFKAAEAPPAASRMKVRVIEQKGE